MTNDRFRLSRRQLLGSSAAASFGALSATATAASAGTPSPAIHDGTIPFHGPHQAGIATEPQDHLAFVTFDVADITRTELASTLDAWSDAAARLATGRPMVGSTRADAPPADTGEATGRGPSNLTMTLGFGASLFRSSLGLEGSRPSGLVDIPAFPGDQLDATRSGGDLAVQICADDPQVVFHALHTLARLGLGTVALRFVQHGFGRTSVTSTSQKTERNLLGFKDGTNNLLGSDSAGMERFVWVRDPSQPAWMQGGTYLVNRRIRTRLELWNETPLGIQEGVVGRFRSSGAPLSGHREHDRVDLVAQNAAGQPVIPTGAHIRVASPSANGGERILRRGYGFADGVDPVTGELDAGLVFICFQRDPERQFVAIQERLSASDTLHGYLVHTASGLYACPRGLRSGEGWGSLLGA